MNLTKFLECVDNSVTDMSKEELKRFVHDIAREYPEEKRNHFLDKLEKIQASTEADKKEKRENFVDKNFLRMYECITENLEDINNQEFMLSAELNEEYDDWYRSDLEEFIYTDPEELLPMIDEACDFVHRCIDMEAFSYGYDIAERLSVLEVAAENEYTGEDLFTISELMRGHHLLRTGYKSFASEATYVAYQGNVLADRADALYRMIEKLQFSAFTLEQMMQQGEELPETEEFMDLWIAYLGNVSSRQAKRLLKEAVELGNNPEQLLENARKYYQVHPSLYEQYIDESIHDAGSQKICGGSEKNPKNL